MLRTSFSSIQDMLDYNQAIQSALERLYYQEEDKWNNTSSDKMCDPSIYNTYFNVEFDLFVIPCWLSCEVTYTGGFADNDSYVPYTVEIPLQWVEEYLKENCGYEEML